MNIKNNQRDVSILKLDKQKFLVIACDSAGGIGSKKGDQLQVPAEIIGKFTVRVPLMEVMAVGGDIINITDTLSVELKPTGEKIITGISEEIKTIGLNPEEIINGSTEENMLTTQTGIGVTVIGIVNKSNLKLANSLKNDIIVAVGYPFFGDELLCNENLIADLEDMKAIKKLDFIHDIIPVGSKGIMYEANILASMSKLVLQLNKNININIEKSAGPATVLLLSLSKKYLDKLKQVIIKPLTLIGELK